MTSSRFSSDLMAADSEGCDMCSLSAARPKLSSSATAMKYRASRTSTIDMEFLSLHDLISPSQYRSSRVQWRYEWRTRATDCCIVVRWSGRVRHHVCAARAAHPDFARRVRRPLTGGAAGVGGHPGPCPVGVAVGVVVGSHRNQIGN